MHIWVSDLYYNKSSHTDNQIFGYQCAKVYYNINYTHVAKVYVWVWPNIWECQIWQGRGSDSNPRTISFKVAAKPLAHRHTTLLLHVHVWSLITSILRSTIGIVLWGNLCSITPQPPRQAVLLGVRSIWVIYIIINPRTLITGNRILLY